MTQWKMKGFKDNLFPFSLKILFLEAKTESVISTNFENIINAEWNEE